jgi:hypothetical protein
MEWLRREVLDVDVDEAEVVVLERALALGGPLSDRLGPAVQVEDAPDTVAIEVRQEMAHNEGQIIEGEVGRPAHSTDDGPLLIGGFPREPVRLGGVVQAIGSTTFAPLADGLGADAIVPGQDARGLS